ncbi:MAG: phosphoadenylyl-sulfate reductase [Anaerolineae bacterium]|nr:phosphoadenylyl-sulfate reductase [Anaerolineae bacterium]
MTATPPDRPIGTDLDIPRLNEQLEGWPAEDILAWAWATLGPDVAVSSSFQTQSVPLLYLVSQVCPEMPVIFVDTGFHFPETLAFRDELQARYNLNIVVARPAIEKSQMLQQYGEGLYRRDPDLCCYLHKVEPMQRAIAGLRGWISGVRRDQTAHRATLRVIEAQPGRPLKIHPLLNWTRRDLWRFINAHDLPAHPLFAQGYLSVGCAPCTRPVTPGEDERAGRWEGADKTECGLHVDLIDPSADGQERLEREDGRTRER